MDYEKYFNHAKDYIEKEVQRGTVFEVKHLFEGVVWEALSRGEKITFGKYFSNAVNDGRIKTETKLERAKNNHSRYRKLEDNAL